MFTTIEHIFITGFDGGTKTMHFPKANLNNVKISELKSKIRDVTGVGVEDQRLLYMTKELESEHCGCIMTLGDYGISGGAVIMMVTRLYGGGGPGLNPLKFADVTSKDKFVPIEFDSSAPKWRRVNSGLSFAGVCKQSGCAAIDDTVIVNKGFYKSSGGHCMLNSQITKLECPMCHVKLKKEQVRGVGIYKCQLTVEYLQEGTVDEGSYDIVSKDKYQYAGCMDEKDKIQYDYIILIVKDL